VRDVSLRTNADDADVPDGIDPYRTAILPLALQQVSQVVEQSDHLGADFDQIRVQLHLVGIRGKRVIAQCLRKGNVLGLKWDAFAFEFAPASTRIVGGELRLPGAVLKNKRALTLPLTGRLLDVVARRYELRQGERVFHRDGVPVWTFVAVWRDATADIGRPGFLFHDLRRSGARALRRLGVDELTIMALGGWKTRSMFARYSIVDGTDLADAQAKLSTALASPGTAKVTPLRRPA
jgi:integrase